MISNSLIIVFFNTPKDWVCDYCLQTAIYLAKKNTVLAFLWEDSKSLKEILADWIKKKKKPAIFWVEKGLIFYRPIHFLPFRRFVLVEKTNLRINILLIKIISSFLILKKRLKSKLIWCFDQKFYLIPDYFKGRLSIYDCVDYSSSIDSKEDKLKKNNEKKLIKNSDVVFVNSSTLYRLKKSFHQRVFQVPQGGDMELFLHEEKSSLPQELKKIPHPRIGFIGNINYRLDFPLIKKLAVNNKNFSLIFLGPIVYDGIQDKVSKLQANLKALKKIKNVFFLGKRAKDVLINYLDYFDVCIIPYDISQGFNRYSYPMKVFEYFCRGKPVVSTKIESLMPLRPYVKIAKGAISFEREIKKIFRTGWPKNYIKRQKQLAVANSWQAKIETISLILKKEFPEKFNA